MTFTQDGRIQHVMETNFSEETREELCPCLERENRQGYWPIAIEISQQKWDISTPIRKFMILNSHPLWDDNFFYLWISVDIKDKPFWLWTYWDTLVVLTLERFQGLYGKKRRKLHVPQTTVWQDRPNQWKSLFKVLPWDTLIEETIGTKWPCETGVAESTRRTIELSARCFLDLMVEFYYQARREVDLEKEYPLEGRKGYVPLCISESTPAWVKEKFQIWVDYNPKVLKYQKLWSNPTTYVIRSNKALRNWCLSSGSTKRYNSEMYSRTMSCLQQTFRAHFRDYRGFQYLKIGPIWD